MSDAKSIPGLKSSASVALHQKCIVVNNTITYFIIVGWNLGISDICMKHKTMHLLCKYYTIVRCQQIRSRHTRCLSPNSICIGMNYVSMVLDVFGSSFVSNISVCRDCNAIIIIFEIGSFISFINLMNITETIRADICQNP